MVGTLWAAVSGPCLPREADSHLAAPCHTSRRTAVGSAEHVDMPLAGRVGRVVGVTLGGQPPRLFGLLGAPWQPRLDGRAEDLQRPLGDTGLSARGNSEDVCPVCKRLVALATDGRVPRHYGTIRAPRPA
jgi:hypothetical protein